MTEFISRKYGNEGYEVIIKTDNHEHYKESENFARQLIDHAKPVTDNNDGCKWIPVSERLPDQDGTYVVFTESGCVTTARYYLERDFCNYRGEFIRHESGRFHRKATHWMPLPEAPKEV